jgi:hypothetical protein
MSLYEECSDWASSAFPLISYSNIVSLSDGPNKQSKPLRERKTR